MALNKRWFIRVVINYLAQLVIIEIAGLTLIEGLLQGLLYTLVNIWLIIPTVRENKLFTPIAPALVFDMAFGLYQLQLVNTYKEMSTLTMTMIATSMFIWKLIVISNKAFTEQKKHQSFERMKIDDFSFKLIITILFLISSFAMIFEWYKAGGIPQLRSDVETFRFTVSYSSIMHIFAIMSKIVAMLIGVYFVNKGKISFFKDFVLIFEFIVSELLMVGTAMRGEMILAPVVIFIVYALKHKLPLKMYVIGAVCILLVIGIMPYIRSSSLYGLNYILSLKSISKYPALYMFTPLYESFGTNFNILNIDISIFPNNKPFGFGIYSILPQIPFANLGSSLMMVQNEVLNKSFYSGLTATYLASWYADFGYIGFIAITVFLAVWNNYIFKKFIYKFNILYCTWYAYTFYSSLWMFYNNTIDFVYICYSLVIIAAFKLKIKRN